MRKGRIEKTVAHSIYQQGRRAAAIERASFGVKWLTKSGAPSKAALKPTDVFSDRELAEAAARRREELNPGTRCIVVEL